MTRQALTFETEQGCRKQGSAGVSECFDCILHKFSEPNPAHFTIFVHGDPKLKKSYCYFMKSGI